MGSKVTDPNLSTVRSIVGSEFTDMEIIRALHLAKNDVTSAINIIFDTQRVSLPKSTPRASNTQRGSPPNSTPRAVVPGAVTATATSKSNANAENNKCSVELESKDWWFVGSGEVAGLSTCKGRNIKAGDKVIFKFPPKKVSVSPSPGKGFGRAAASCSEIVRFSNEQDWEIGRIPNEWARCLLPLVRDNKVRVEGKCEFAPNVLGIMDSINLSISVFINRSMFVKHHQVSLKDATNSTDESVFHPLPALFRLLGLSPFKKAELTPGDFYSNKRPFSQTATLLHAKSEHPSQNGNENEDEDSVSEFDLDNIVGVASSSELEEMDPPGNLLCELRPYQKQALHWMVQMEKGRARDETATTLHPCWEAYRLADKRELVVYLNAFSGEATTEFPSTLQMARGGILADAMGLGKTIMTISLLVAHSGKGGSLGSQPIAQSFIEGGEVSDTDTIPNLSKVPKKTTKFTGFDKSTKKNTSLTSGGNLIICPMTLLGQWKAEIETHVHPGTLSLYVHYGQGRPKDAKSLAQCDVVITTYGILASDFSSENGENNGGLFSIRWFRVVLDEAHTIKSSKSQVSMAASALIADNRWCLTGTPIQNNLEDVYSLLRFLRIEPWGHWAWWNKLIQKPFEGGDERGLKLVQSILKPIMLRRTKHSTDREGKPILVLPPADMQIIYCEPTEAEKDFYEALFKRSKVKFDQFVEQGRVLHNYASILELLLRLRQCCDHPFLVMSRGDTQEFADLNKLAKRFLRGTCNASEGEVKDALSRAYVQEVVEELRKGEQGECPICLEAFEDSVLTPCAHRLCRECLLASWRNSTSGLCPVCRKTVSKQDLITAPTESRFQIDIEKNWVESCKVTGLMNELENLRSSGSKSIVFSQWTAFLDLLQIPFTRNKISFVRLDGTLNLQQREKVIKQFSEDSDIQVLLMSLKAGGVGINLTAASNAFVMDPWWNPAVEEQAVMRIHRIGQTKKVAIKRFIVKGSVEQRMEAVQARKQRMISGALTDQEVRSARIEELKMLFT
ncbi:putative DNA helicase chromatin remodeling SNF2 family [Medicago truncatula]|uniref:Putative DNA helicase chromatin remodeling SNF2 family n=1 Tax=Medicago truncatula TaxID=3880 RepID=A0A396JK03_MEDTR|nr:DNA repair protein RAD5A isoform X1 [Medicago truncatula]RHN75397.1 putative DNA helicase chromatin remodeling SNF2 family [Medicago truncatula]